MINTYYYLDVAPPDVTGLGKMSFFGLTVLGVLLVIVIVIIVSCIKNINEKRSVKK